MIKGTIPRVPPFLPMTYDTWIPGITRTSFGQLLARKRYEKFSQNWNEFLESWLVCQDP